MKYASITIHDEETISINRNRRACKTIYLPGLPKANSTQIRTVDKEVDRWMRHLQGMGYHVMINDNRW